MNLQGKGKIIKENSSSGKVMSGVKGKNAFGKSKLMNKSRGFHPSRDSYNKKDTRVEYQLFSQDYFSGADMHIYFGDIWVDEITDISFQLQEEILPIYGYHSYTFDHVARGRRMISGMFTMNFKSVGYLQEIMRHSKAIDYTLNNAGAIAGVTAGMANSKNIDVKYYEKYKLDEILSLYGKESFEQIASEYENAIWGVGGNHNLLNEENQPFFQSNMMDGFDIRIHYGAVEETYKNQSNSFEQPNLTVESINGIQITGLQKSAATSNQGSPVQETYTFVAKDINSPFKSN